MEDTRIRLLLVMERLAIGGAERRFWRIARDLPKDRFDVRIGVLAPGGELATDFAQLGLPILDFSRRWRYDLSPPLRIARYCASEQIAVAHGMLWLSSTFAGWARPFMPQTTIIGSTVQDVYHVEHLGRLRALSDRFLARRLHTMVVNTPKLRDFLVSYGYPAKRITIIPNGIDIPDIATLAERRRDLRTQWGVPADAPCAGILAMLRPEKDHMTFLQAAQIVQRAIPAAQFVIAGDGPESARLEAAAATLGLADHVRFLGAVAGPDAAVPAWDASVLSSRHEGMPNAVLEAMAWARPVVATDVQGVTDMVADGATGYVVPMGDASALAARLITLLTQPDQAARMGQTGRARVIAHWSVARMVADYQSLYEGCRAPTAPAHVVPTPRQEITTA